MAILWLSPVALTWSMLPPLERALQVQVAVMSIATPDDRPTETGTMRWRDRSRNQDIAAVVACMG